MSARTRKKLIKLVSALLTVLILTLLASVVGPPDTKLHQVAQQATPGLYEVIKFDDGDTIQVDMQGKHETIRFIGVDTPEKNDPRKPVQCFAKDASEFTKQTIGMQRVRLEADPTNSNRDRYQRLLRYIYLPDGTLLNKKLVEDGYGFVTTGFPFTKMEEFQTVQQAARAQNRGLWGVCTITDKPGYFQTNAL